MSLESQLLARLAKRNPTDENTTFSVQDTESGWSATLSASSIDTIGCHLAGLSLTPSSSLALTDLQEWAQTICDRVLGLLEPLRVIEISQSESKVLIRSVRVSQHDHFRDYYELVLRSSGACTLHRYRASTYPSEPRKSIPFEIMHSTLGKLIQSLTKV